MGEGSEDQTTQPPKQDQTPPEVQGIALDYEEVKKFLGELCLLAIEARSRLRDTERRAIQSEQAVFSLMNRVRSLEGGAKSSGPA